MTEFMEFLPAISSLLGTLGGILISSKLTTYRIEQLEKKVEKHNSVIDRTYKLESKDAIHDEQIKQLWNEINSKGVKK